MLCNPSPVLASVLKFWSYFFLLASVPSCMPVYSQLHRLLCTGLSLSQTALKTMATSVSSLDPQASLFSVSYVTVPNDTIAKYIARGLIERKLAACVNVIPQITSIYSWKNEIHEDTEVMMIIKSRISLLESMTNFIRENHPYEVCEVISSPLVHGNPPYLEWLYNVTMTEQDVLNSPISCGTVKPK